MLHNVEAIFKDDNQFNLVTQLGRKIFTSSIFNHKCSEYIKFARIVAVQVFGSVENECTFNTVSFMKNRL